MQQLESLHPPQHATPPPPSINPTTPPLPRPKTPTPTPSHPTQTHKTNQAACHPGYGVRIRRVLVRVRVLVPRALRRGLQCAENTGGGGSGVGAGGEMLKHMGGAGSVIARVRGGRGGCGQPGCIARMGSERRQVPSAQLLGNPPRSSPLPHHTTTPPQSLSVLHTLKPLATRKPLTTRKPSNNQSNPNPPHTRERTLAASLSATAVSPLPPPF